MKNKLNTLLDELKKSRLAWKDSDDPKDLGNWMGAAMAICENIRQEVAASKTVIFHGTKLRKSVVIDGNEIYLNDIDKFTFVDRKKSLQITFRLTEADRIEII